MALDIKKILVEDLSVGMHVEDVFNDKGFLLFSVNAELTSTRQIEQLKKRGVKSVFIRCEAERIPVSSENIQEPVREDSQLGIPHERSSLQAFRREVKAAQSLYSNIVNTVSECMAAAKSGRMFSIKGVEAAVAGMLESIQTNLDVLMCLSQIKRFAIDEYRHGVNVAVLVTALGHTLCYREDELLQAGIGALLHDIGKTRIPPQILAKQGRLTRREFEIVKRHPAAGVEMLKGKKGIGEVALAVTGQHHERYDGKGYPRGRAAGNVPEIAYIAGLADSYDALTTDRIYASARLPQEALAVIFQGCNSDFPRTLIEYFTRLVGIYPVGSFVEFESGEKGIITRSNRQKLLEPDVLLVLDSDGTRFQEPCECDLAWRSSHPDAKGLKIKRTLNPRNYDIEPGIFLEKILIKAA